MDRQNVNLGCADHAVDDAVGAPYDLPNLGFSNSGTARPESGKVAIWSMAAISWRTTTAAYLGES